MKAAMSDWQPQAPSEDAGYRSPFLDVPPSPPEVGYPQEPPYAQSPPPPPSGPPTPPPPGAGDLAAPAAGPLFDHDALFRAPAPPPPPPTGYPVGGHPDGPRFTPVTIAACVVAVLALVVAGVWAIGQGDQGVKKAEPLTGGVAAAPDQVGLADLPPPPPIPVGYVPRHISGMTFAVPADCEPVTGSGLADFTYDFITHVHILDVCISGDGNRIVMVTSADSDVPPDAKLQDPATRDRIRMLFAVESLAPPEVTTGQVLGRPGLMVSAGFTCSCHQPVYFTAGVGSGADNDVYEVLVGQKGSPPDAAPVIDSARPTR